MKKILVNATSSKDDLEIDGEASKTLISRIEDDTNQLMSVVVNSAVTL